MAFAPRPPATAPPTAARRAGAHLYAPHSQGKWCRDGSDLLEGPLDGYTDCDAQTRLCTLTKKCRARCSKRAACRYYTSYPSGYCQLSSACADEAAASETGARTFRKVVEDEGGLLGGAASREEGGNASHGPYDSPEPGVT